MLFNSYVFIFLFLPIVVFIFFLISKININLGVAWLVLVSLFYYAWWDPHFLYLIIFSILFNFSIGRFLSSKNKYVNIFFICGIVVNLAFIVYFKYFNFFIYNVNMVIGVNYDFKTLILPLAISFFTFQQITYLVDAYNGQTREYNFLNYCLFVTFFPQLIAGPIVHHREILPQFREKEIYKFKHENLSVGLTIFFLGLFKKVIIADGVALFASSVFELAEAGHTIAFSTGWIGALSYTFQIYFDFSGYSDMAIGIARIFGIKLPLNFYSPYKAVNIIDFWRRWHLTLSRFLKEYIYIPLGGNKKGKKRRYINLFITMILGGLWHGAGWTFVFWGGLHGFYLIINHGWHAIKKTLGITRQNSIVLTWISRTTTFIAVVIGWVFFRAASFNGAKNIILGMTGFNGIGLPKDDEISALVYILVLLLFVWFLPNIQQIMINYEPTIKSLNYYNEKIVSVFQWKPSYYWIIITFICSIFSILMLNTVSEFLYFNF
jgi:alginate O-acetyltransferase complex protein AlgI